MNPNNKGKARTPITNNNNNYPQIQMDKHHKIILIIKKNMELAKLLLKNIILEQIKEKGM